MATQEDRFLRRVFSPKIDFCSKDKACLYAISNSRGPDEQTLSRRISESCQKVELE